MDSIALFLGYWFIALILIGVICSLIYWLHRLYKHIIFRIHYTKLTPYYVYRLRKNEVCHGLLLPYITEQYIVERRKRYHIFSRYEQLYTSTTNVEDAFKMLENYINEFAKNNGFDK